MIINYVEESTKRILFRSVGPEVFLPPVGTEVDIEFADGTQVFHVVRNRVSLKVGPIDPLIDCYLERC
jgi:hypothetical protein